MKRDIVFELCAEGIDACLAARDGGADRIELCSALSEGGLTPSHALMRAAVTQTGLPVHVILRPRTGDFVYSEPEFQLMQEDLEHARELGVSGFVAGILRPDRTVDSTRMYRLVELASPLEVTFHRAFDMTENLEAALEDVIASGCRRLLTSGGAADVYAGAETLCRLNEQADGRIAIAVGGGLRLKGAAELARKTGVQQFHGSVRNWEAALGRVMTKPNNVRMMIAALETGLAQAGRMAPFT